MFLPGKIKHGISNKNNTFWYKTIVFTWMKLQNITINYVNTDVDNVIDVIITK